MRNRIRAYQIIKCLLVQHSKGFDLIPMIVEHQHSCQNLAHLNDRLRLGLVFKRDVREDVI